MLGIWLLWAVVGVVLLGLILYRTRLTEFSEDELFADNAPTAWRLDQLQTQARVERLKPWIRVVGGIEGLVTLAIAAMYLLDALRQF